MPEEFKHAAKNLKNDRAQYARYIYKRCCDYMMDHEGNSIKLIEAALEAWEKEHVDPSKGS